MLCFVEADESACERVKLNKLFLMIQASAVVPVVGLSSYYSENDEMLCRVESKVTFLRC